MTSTEQKNVRGGGSSDTLKNAVEVGFSGWKDWADESEYSIKTYTSLEQMGLSDAEMSPDDFAGNIERIGLAIADRAFTACLPVVSYLKQSILKKLTDDGLPYNNSASMQIMIERPTQKGASLKAYLFTNAGNFPQNVMCNIRQNGEHLTAEPFREAAYTEKLLEEITLLNGWEKQPAGMRIAKNGNYVSMNFIIDKGIRDVYTKLFNLPSNFAPKVDTAIPVVCWSQAEHKHVNGLLTVSKTGEVTIRILDPDSDGVMICASGFTI